MLSTYDIVIEYKIKISGSPCNYCNHRNFELIFASSCHISPIWRDEVLEARKGVALMAKHQLTTARP